MELNPQSGCFRAGAKVHAVATEYFHFSWRYVCHDTLAERPELRHAGPTSVNREAELDRPSRVACSEVLGGIVIWFVGVLRQKDKDDEAEQTTGAE
jgi:hypothetical protein